MSVRVSVDVDVSVSVSVSYCQSTSHCEGAPLGHFAGKLLLTISVSISIM